ANAYVFDFGDWRLASRRAAWRRAEPTPSQQAALRRAWVTDPDEMRRIAGDRAHVVQRGEASGVISTLHLLGTRREGKPESREWALARFAERYGGDRHDRRLLAVAGPPDSPLVAALRRTYVELWQTRRESFQQFLRRTLERCTLQVDGSRL